MRTFEAVALLDAIPADASDPRDEAIGILLQYIQGRGKHSLIVAWRRLRERVGESWDA